ncbi:MAG: MotA/TolQ/ExbB proton channel family protein [Verrucomicrobia bacterium]|nr:MotA/TolQ/ExbB proton channel family protein [Verrucomicrobiota bacterium]
MQSMSLGDLFARGGSLMWVLLAFSFVALAVTVERVLTYTYYGFTPDRWFESILQKIRTSGVSSTLTQVSHCRHPVARVVQTYLEQIDRPAKIREDNVRRTGSHVLESVEKNLRILAALAHLSPLVGLLGTVIGMVLAFSQIQSIQGTVKPSDLAGGIWEALLTTVFGLVVAIPCMALYHAMEGHADKIARRMEWAVTALDDLFAVSPAPGTSSNSTSRRRNPNEEFSAIQ